MLPFRGRNPFLLFTSYYFYMNWKWEFGFLMLFASLINYLAALKISENTDILKRKLWLALGLISSLGVLVYFKYANFFIHEAIDGLQGMGMSVRESSLNVILPVGISFFTFQAMSYSIDVYRKDMHVEKDPFRVLLFVSFFPQLVAGPIERATNLLEQFREKHYFQSSNIIQGGKIIVWGLFKKVVIADRLASYVSQVYTNPEAYGGSTLFLATLFFAFQIYCDFSGYSDIAIGSAHILGFRLMQNFNLPYLATSIKDFWHRWHISLSTWFSDYVYKPLGGNRVKKSRWAFNIMAVYLVSGLWHGANWTFLAWGGTFGLLYVAEHYSVKMIMKAGLKKVYESGIMKVIRTGFIFICVLVAWVFFRAENMIDARYIISHMFTNWSIPYLGPSAFETVLGFGLIILLYLIQIMQYRGVFSIYMSESNIPVAFRWIGYAMLLVIIAWLGVASEQFIYFQF